MSQSQFFLPAMWLGPYNFQYGFNQLSFDQETNVGIHPILGQLEQTEPTGFTSQKISFNGFFYSTSSSAFTALQNFVASGNFHNRPMSVGFFSQDPANASPWFNNVGYLSNVHVEFRGGYGVYKYPFRFNFIQANPVTTVPTSTAIGTQVGYGFPMTGLTAGWLVGLQMTGPSIQTNGTALSMTVLDNTSTQIGTGAVVGVSPNTLFATGGTATVTAGVQSPPVSLPLTMPFQANDGSPSIRVSNAPGTVTYSVVLNTGFVASHLPSTLTLAYVQI